MKKNSFLTIFKKNTTNFLGIIVLIVLAWAAYYINDPAREKLSRYKKDLAATNAEITRVEAMIDQDKTIAEMLTLLNEREDYLLSKLPAKEEGALDALTALAQQAEVEYISSSLRPKKICYDKNGKMLRIHDKICREIFVSLQLKGSFENIVRYIELLYSKLPSFITVELLQIRNQGQAMQLDVSIDLKIHTLSS